MSGRSPTRAVLRAESGPADVVAAGAVLWRPGPPGGTGAGTEVALVHRARYDDWSLPKGKPHRGESAPAAAAREVTEETGVPVVLGVRLGESRYQVPQGDKLVHYWAARAAGTGAFTPDDEVDRMCWLSPEEAAGRLTYPRDAEILARFRDLSPDGRPPVPVVLTRHAKAGSRNRWAGDDDLRPLSARGRRQAGQLADLLALFGPRRAYAAPPLRCPDTIRPLADRLDLTVEIEPLLGEEVYWRDPDAGLARFLALAGSPGVAVVCSQGGVIPDLVERLTGLADATTEKAGTWVLGLATGSSGDAPRTVDRYPAPDG